MTIDEYLADVWGAKRLSANVPDREPGCDDDRRPGESWVGYVIELAKHFRTDPTLKHWRPQQ